MPDISIVKEYQNIWLKMSSTLTNLDLTCKSAGNMDTLNPEKGAMFKFLPLKDRI